MPLGMAQQTGTVIATADSDIVQVMPGQREAGRGYNQYFTEYW